MKKLWLLLPLLLLLSACGTAKETSSKQEIKDLKKVTLVLDYVPNTARKMDIEYAMSNSLGFGGHNASLVFKKVQQ